MPLGTQSRLLRVLENGEYIKVGSSKILKTNVRVVAASHVNLYEAVQKGEFREDLYYRLNTIPISVPPLRERGSDIHLLFRKFTSDFSEKHHVSPIHLNEEAIELLLRYRFPGNIRQLKNIVDQLSVLEVSRLITKDTLSKYLPHHPERSLPTIQNKEKDISERDILYKVLFDMKKDMNELKKVVLDAVKDGGLNSNVISEHKELFDNIEESSHSNHTNVPSLLLSESTQGNFKPTIVREDANSTKIEDVFHEDHEESLSIDEKEKELIIKALEKNNNKRKYAAEDLGISERTLYRKIKHYDISK